jgi:DNA-binding response OmpR family regulator
VVDDDLGLQDLFRTFLKKIGFSRVVVGTVKEAIKSLSANLRACLKSHDLAASRLVIN